MALTKTLYCRKCQLRDVSFSSSRRGPRRGDGEGTYHLGRQVGGGEDAVGLDLGTSPRPVAAIVGAKGPALDLLGVVVIGQRVWHILVGAVGKGPNLDRRVGDDLGDVGLHGPVPEGHAEDVSGILVAPDLVSGISERDLLGFYQ